MSRPVSRMKRHCKEVFFLCLGATFVLSCGTPESSPSEESAVEPEMASPERPEDLPPIVANNAFFYYDDVDAAWAFYRDVVGLTTVADYGFAKILRIAGSSLLTLVDADEGMHTADEPKTVAIALVTDELEQWFEYLKTTQVEFRSELKVTENSAHDGFVVYDPEGYYLEFERFNPHSENEELIPRLNAAESVYPSDAQLEPAKRGLGFKATVLWMYYKDMAASEAFYENVLGFDRIVDQGWAKIYPTSQTGYIGLVDETRGMHSFTQDKGVTASFLTEDVEPWFDYLASHSDFSMRTPELVSESEKVLVFVGYDPENYFLEFDQFLDRPGNELLLETLSPYLAE